MKEEKDKPTEKKKNNKQEIENPNPPLKPEKGNGGELTKNKPEIRYEIEN